MFSSLLSLFILVSLALTGLAVTGIAATKPKTLWLLLIAISIIASGMMPFGYTIVDEYLTASFLFGVFMYLAVAKVPFHLRQDGDHLARLHRFFFLVMMAYMILQAIRGIVELESLQKIRWVIFYSIIGLLMIILYTKRFALPSSRQVALTMTLSTFVYLVLFVLSGFAADLYGLTAWFETGIGRWAVQTTWWGSTAYSMLPIAVAMPAIFFCLRDRSKRFRRAGWSTLLLAIFSSLYYDSRVALLAIVAFLVVALPLLGTKRFATALLSFAIILSMFFSFIWPSYRDARFFVEDTFLSWSTLWQPQAQMGISRDIDRWIHMQVAFRSIADSWTTFLFGHGLRMHGQKISPYVYELYQEFLPEQSVRIGEDVSTEGFTALVVDTGIVGLLLHLMNFMFVGLYLLHQKRNNYRYVLLTSLFMLFMWLFVINMLDTTLFYLAIMPSGLLLLMARSPGEKTLPDLSPAVTSHRIGAA